jgi:hypothetical protein
VVTISGGGSARVAATPAVERVTPACSTTTVQRRLRLADQAVDDDVRVEPL